MQYVFYATSIILSYNILKINIKFVNSEIQAQNRTLLIYKYFVEMNSFAPNSPYTILRYNLPKTN